MNNIMKGISCCADCAYYSMKKHRCTRASDEGKPTDHFYADCPLPTVTKEQGWISVKDRLPEKQTPVLVYVPPYSDEDEEYIGHVTMSYYTHFALGGYWAGTDGNVYGAIGIIHEPTHWMPLPEPPKEG